MDVTSVVEAIGRHYEKFRGRPSHFRHLRDGVLDPEVPLSRAGAGASMIEGPAEAMATDPHGEEGSGSGGSGWGTRWSAILTR